MCEYTCEEHARGLALCHTLCPSSCPTLTPWKRSSSLRALSQPAPSSWWLFALSSSSSSVPDQLPALPTYSQPQQKKITHLVTDSMHSSNQQPFTPCSYNPKQQTSPLLTHRLLYLCTRDFQQHISIPVLVYINLINSPDTCAIALRTTIQCCSYKWQL